MRKPTPIEVGQALCLALIVVALFLLLPVAWAMLVVGSAGAALLTLVEHAARPAPATGEIIESTATETDGA